MLRPTTCQLKELDSVPLAHRRARQIGWTLHKLETVSKKATPALSQYKQFFNVRALTVLYSPVMARRFAKGAASRTGITLPAFSPKVAGNLAGGSKSLYLGLTVLDSPEVARALAKSRQGVKLPRLRAATPEVIEILKEAKSIETPPIESVYVLSEVSQVD
ncbi:hypothetical protein [Lignipirellula cremea]|uniref:Uncharacterized protein n=1 Tax=Lignipirellula cremea TaxID=2528010 RepID=A0A518DKQ4_9BACT|nr:hypothetical protein [Lignipirellula cremea]QDU92400.1 hypothetical protein Pla8534_01480 [Lignipirellula cremea]